MSHKKYEPECPGQHGMYSHSTCSLLLLSVKGHLENMNIWSSFIFSEIHLAECYLFLPLFYFILFSSSSSCYFFLFYFSLKHFVTEREGNKIQRLKDAIIFV